MKKIMLQSKVSRIDGYYISDPMYNETIRIQPIPCNCLSDLATRYSELGFDAIGAWEIEGITYVDALTYIATPFYGQYVYDIQLGKHYTYST